MKKAEGRKSAKMFTRIFMSQKRAKVWGVALMLFRKYHGPGDAGSESEFFCQQAGDQEGWLRLARYVMRVKRK